MIVRLMPVRLMPVRLCWLAAGCWLLAAGAHPFTLTWLLAVAVALGPWLPLRPKTWPSGRFLGALGFKLIFPCWLGALPDRLGPCLLTQC